MAEQVAVKKVVQYAEKCVLENADIYIYRAYVSRRSTRLFSIHMFHTLLRSIQKKALCCSQLAEACSEHMPCHAWRNMQPHACHGAYAWLARRQHT